MDKPCLGQIGMGEEQGRVEVDGFSQEFEDDGDWANGDEDGWIKGDGLVLDSDEGAEEKNGEGEGELVLGDKVIRYWRSWRWGNKY